MKNRTICLISLFAIAILGQACKKEKDNCNIYHAPPTTNLVFRLFDPATHQDAFISGRYYLDSVKANQPCSPYDSLIFSGTIYNIPTKNGLPVYKGYVLTFLNLRNPAAGEDITCSSILLKWDSTHYGKIEWNTRMQENGDCPAYPILDQVYYNSQAITPVFDTAYQYYPLYN